MKKNAVFGGFLLLLAALSGVLYWVSGRPAVDFSQRAPDGYNQFMLFLRLSNYELKAASIFILAYIAVGLPNLSTSRRFSYLAVFSSLNVVLNPLVIHLTLMRWRPGDVVGLGDSELRSFAAGVLSFVTGVIALVRIFRSHGSVRGLPFAGVGIVGGGIWVGYWLVSFYRYMSAMRRW